MNDNNLIPVTERTKSEAREISKKGGVASGKARRRNKALNSTVKAMLEARISTYPHLVDLARKCGLPVNATVQELMVTVCLTNTMKKGNVEDLTKLMNLISTVVESECEKCTGLSITIQDNSLDEDKDGAK